LNRAVLKRGRKRLEPEPYQELRQEILRRDGWRYVFPFEMLMLERLEVRGIEFSRGPLTLDCHWLFSTRRQDKVHFVPALVSPVEYLPTL